jgi:hypothetical protein
MLGFVSPEGKLYSCNMYGHISLADKILKEIYSIECNLSVEKLCAKGWIIIQSGFIGFTGHLCTSLTITKEQDDFLIENIKEFSYGQQLSLSITMEINNMYKEDVESQ